MSIMPTGKSSTSPHGTLIAGWPVISCGAVFPIISKARVIYSVNEESESGRGWATIGRVGINRRSYSANFWS
ncbi:hypothetical protein D3C73_1385900 [compost metagenome]